MDEQAQTDSETAPQGDAATPQGVPAAPEGEATAPQGEPAASADEPMDPRTSNPREVMRVLLPAARASYVRAWELLADPNTPLERRRLARERTTAIAEDHALVAQALRAREASLTGDDLLNARHLASELERHVEALGRIATISPIGMQTAKELRPESLGCGRRYRDPAKPAPEAAPAGKPGGGRPRGGKPGGGRPGGGKPGGGSPGGGQPGGGDTATAAAGGAPRTGDGRPGGGGKPGGRGKPRSGGKPGGGKPGGGKPGAGTAGGPQAGGIKPGASRAGGSKPKGGGKFGGKAGGRGDRPDKPRGPKVPRDQLGTTKHDSQLGDDIDAETKAKLEALRKSLEG